MGFPGDPVVEVPPTNRRRHRMWVQSLGWDDPLEEEMATLSSILTWKIPGTEQLLGYSP